MIGRLLREPLLHFLLIGIGLFALYDVLRGGDTGAPRDIVVTEARVEALAESFATVWMRPPTPEEIKGLVDDYIAEEVYYREAIAMGLDQDDTVIRRRLRQKMEFISEDAAAAAEPTDAELQAYLAAHPEKFVEPAELTFVQVYFSTEKRGDGARARRRATAGRTAGRSRPACARRRGRPTLLPGDMQSASPQVIANIFGSEFATQVEEAPVGQWSGPLQSGFGLHLVRVDERKAGALPTLEEIRPLVLREWQAEQRKQANRRSSTAALQVRHPHRGPAGDALGARARRRRSAAARVMRGACALLLFALAGAAPAAQAHEVRPGLPRDPRAAPDAFDVLWKVPAKRRVPLEPVRAAAAGMLGLAKPGHRSSGGAFIERWRARCPGGLVGKEIDDRGPEATRTDVLARIEWLDGTTQTTRLTPEQTSFVVRPRRARSKCRRPISCSASSTSCSASTTCCSCSACCSSWAAGVGWW